MQTDNVIREADALDAFLPEPALPAIHANSLAAEPASRTSPHVISLDDVLAREIPVEWDEAVAVVEELCGLVTAGEGDELPVPEPPGILITADGAVILKHGARGERGASGVGRTLHALLSTASMPVALRLFVTQSTSPDAYASIREFAGALAYFGKPGRAELIRGLYERCAAAGRAASSTRLPVHLPDPEATAKPGSESRARRRRKLPAWFAPAAAAVCLLGAGIWFWSTAAASSTVSSPLPTLIAQTKSAIQKLGTEVRSGLGVDTAPAAGAAESAAAGAPAPASRPPVTSRRNGNRRSPVILIPVEGAQLVPPRLEQAVPDVPVVDPQPTIVPPAHADNSIAEGDRRLVIYSSTDPDVRPPVLLYPQMPTQLMADSRLEAVNRMELIVSESGAVEQVRLVAGPRRMPDMMLLSGAKMWRFKPAVKDGEPVRYRTVVSWIATP